MNPITVAYYTTGHGLGHATRSIEICKHLVDAGHSVIVVTGAPASVFLRELPPARFTLRRATLDSGAIQSDPFTVDQKGSLEEYRITAVQQRDTILATEVSWLRAVHVDLVVSDIVPLACAAASQACVPCVCVTNFSWDFIYSEYLTSAGSEFRALVWQIAEDYASALRVLRLPGHVPMPAFREVVDVPLVVRHARRSKEEVRHDLGIPLDANVVVFIFGGQPAGEWRMQEQWLPPGWVCIVCSQGKLPGGYDLPAKNFILAPEDAYTPDLVGACDVVMGKIGYGTTSECLAHNKPLVFLRRDFFNEEPFLRKFLELHDAAVEIKRRDFLEGNWAPYLERAKASQPHYGEPTNGAEVVAELLINTVQEIKSGAVPLSPAGGMLSRSSSLTHGSSRLRDTIAWGYMMQRHSQRDMDVAVEVSEWYATPGQLPHDHLGLRPGSSLEMHLGSPGSSGTIPFINGFDIVQGNASQVAAFRDTVSFLSTLSKLDDPPPLDHLYNSKELRELPERRAARGLFNWDEDIYIARAPGRLDVMGGIADYSGSLVLQMPLAEACHVAVQRQSADTQRLWKHMKARRQLLSNTSTTTTTTIADIDRTSSQQQEPQPQRSSSLGDTTAAIRIVSFHADATNRGPAFDMDLSELYDEETGEPITYEAAQRFFKRDPALGWAAYVAGGVVALMREYGLMPSDGLSVLITSDVPEGKGVSSSAAVEVATLNALAAAYDIHLDGRELALLAQKVENLVVGAPCGIMDQMSSSLGEEGELLALKCQPAEVQGTVQIPPHIRFWGIDSGIRHCVGGSDYGAVRTGAFMGLRIASELARQDAERAARRNNSRKNQQLGSASISAETQPIGGGYLTNISPSEFSRLYEGRIPESMLGSDFLATYDSHWDSATSINPSTRYAISVPTGHPVAENFRVELFRQLLSSQGDAVGQLNALGELMYQSHESYSRCGLGSEGTDRLVALVQNEALAAKEEGREPALFGAKITGGGSGGVVCVIGRADQEGEAALRRVSEFYAKETSHAPKIFQGSSAGAAHFGVVCVRKRKNV